MSKELENLNVFSETFLIFLYCCSKEQLQFNYIVVDLLIMSKYKLVLNTCPLSSSDDCATGIDLSSSASKEGDDVGDDLKLVTQELPTQLDISDP